jgi:serine/threonine protein kinase
MDTRRLVGRYELIRRLGSGSMGDVYEAHDPKIDRRVAIKILRPDLIERSGGQGRWTERFLQEARAAGRLLHPNIITLYDYGDDAGVPFFAMEFVDGENLSVLLRLNGPLPVSDALTVATQILGALEFAHSRGVVHRDVKPSNIMLMKSRFTKIADFGIAHLETSELTTAGDVLGTPSYMAPEQLAGKPIDNRTDLFGVGAVLFEVLCGEKPFGKTLTESWRNMEQRGPADIRVLNPEVTPALKVAIETALAVDPNQRFASAAAFARAIAGPEILPVPSRGNYVPTNEETLTATFEAESPSLPAAVTTGESLISLDTLGQVERDLTEFIGPIARTLVRRSASTIPELAMLCERLAIYIEDVSERAKFLIKCNRLVNKSLPRTAEEPSAATATGSGASVASVVPSMSLAPEMLSRLEAALTEYIGPIARIVIRKQLLKSSSLADLYGDLAAYIPNDRDRAAFLKSQRGG